MPDAPARPVDLSVSARRWPQRLTSAQREDLLLDVLAEHDGRWLDVATIRRVASPRGFKVATGTTASILQRLAAADRCQRRQNGTTSVYRVADALD